jgi:DNA-binding NtrC family response regulator
MQVKLLRVLQEREVRRVGENKSRPVDVRVVAATNRDLRAEVEAGGFRQDLFYRLRVIEVAVPPLRTRKEDVLPLARSFLLDLNESMGLQKTAFAPDAADQLLRYDWPGNVRELQNAVERAAVLAETDRIESWDLPEEVRSPELGLPGLIAAGSTLADLERRAIMGALEANGGNRTRAAQQLGIGAATLYRKLKQYGHTARH